MLGSNETGLNIEYLFRLIYECLIGACLPGDASALLAQIWLWIIFLGYLIAIIGIFIIIFTTVKIFDLRKREAEHLEEVVIAPETLGANPRWAHVESLMEGTSMTDWRQAIIEADIMLDDMLARQGYQGAGVGEKLKNVEASDFDTLQDAWEAHKIRNQIAHEGSSFDLSETLARRTIARYETVFREFSYI